MATMIAPPPGIDPSVVPTYDHSASATCERMAAAERPPVAGFSESGRGWARAAAINSSRDHSAQRRSRAISSAGIGSRSLGKAPWPKPRSLRSMTWFATTSSIGSGSGTTSP
jgi:hypothetical protein